MVRTCRNTARYTARLDAARTATAMDMPVFGFIPLKGELEGYYAVTVRANWRVIFRFANHDAYDLIMSTITKRVRGESSKPVGFQIAWPMRP